MGLKRKGRERKKAGAILGSALAVSGCVAPYSSYNDNYDNQQQRQPSSNALTVDDLGLLLGIGGTFLGLNARTSRNLTPQQRAGSAYVADVIERGRLVRAGRNNVQQNVNVYNQGWQGQRQRQAQNAFFACREYKDLNRDGLADFPQEFLGINNVFSRDEGVSFVSRFVNQKGKVFVFNLYNNEDGSLVDTKQRFISEDDYFVWYNYHLSKGAYVGAWRITGAHTPLGRIKIRAGQIGATHINVVD